MSTTQTILPESSLNRLCLVIHKSISHCTVEKMRNEGDIDRNNVYIVINMMFVKRIRSKL